MNGASNRDVGGGLAFSLILGAAGQAPPLWLVGSLALGFLDLDAGLTGAVIGASLA